MALLDVDGYWAGLVDLLRHAVGEGFVRPEYAALLVEASDPDALLESLTAWVPPAGIRVWRAPPPI